jgi:DNA-binding transcriptional MerR regulator
MNGQFARAYLGIGEVLVELRDEFPDISVSKIRFLESEGLISPARSPSGYRRFAPADVQQLRFILTAQRDQYLPLRVIKERLEHQAAQPKQPDRAEMVSRRELLDAAGIDEHQLADLEAHGLVKRVGRLYGQDALDVASTVARLADYGVQARHLRTVRTAAERDVSMIEQLVGPTLRQRSPGARTGAGRTAHQIAAHLLRLHRAMLESALADAGLPGPGLTESGLTESELAQSELAASDLAGDDRHDPSRQRAERRGSGVSRRSVADASA